MQIFIKNLENKSMIFDVESLTTIYELKKSIKDRLGIDPEIQRLIFGGKQLEDDRKLYDYNIEHCHTIHLCLKLRGD